MSSQKTGGVTGSTPARAAPVQSEQRSPSRSSLRSPEWESVTFPPEFVPESGQSSPREYSGGNPIHESTDPSLRPGPASPAPSPPSRQPSSSSRSSESEGESDHGSRKGNGDDGPGDEEPNTRVVYINDPDRTNEKAYMANNQVRTSKYTILSFLPKNLFEQFHRFAYIYFLVIAILNQIPMLTVFGRTASIFPLALVLLVTGIKDAYEDTGRYKSDRIENNRTSLVLEDGGFAPKKWRDMRVGEVVKVYANEMVPCDVVLLGTSDAFGVGYVDTMNLDGESNLKVRYTVEGEEAASKHPNLGEYEAPNGMSGTLICEQPQDKLYEFTAFMDLGDAGRLPLGPNNIVLRGCKVKNTSWIVGVVVYAGQETKALLNTSGSQSKKSKLEREMNRETLWLGVFLLLMCLVGGIGMALWVNRHSDDLDRFPFYKKKYVDGNANYRYYGVLGEGIIGFLSCVIVFQIMIPLSLYISIELVRLGQVYFMTRDLNLYHAPTDSPFQCRALNINEDLGQVKYVFSDKTGTLTENKMEFFAASINGIDFRGDESSSSAFEYVSEVEAEGSPDQRALKPKGDVKVDQNLVRLLRNESGSGSSELTEAVRDYMLVLAACNTIVPTRVTVSVTGQLEMQAAHVVDEQEDMPTRRIEYQGESPDEQALVLAAAAYGYTLLQRTPTYVLIDVLGDTQKFEVLGMHEFDSVRKRMSVIVRCPGGKIKLLVKGADSAIFSNLKLSEDSRDITSEPENSRSKKGQGEILRTTEIHLDRYAREGLRTFVVATKTLDDSAVQVWDAQYRKAVIAVADRANMMRTAADLVEADLTLLGALGIEDKLQKGVPETIRVLRAAGLQVWILTGDKQETAISIAFSCSLLTREMEQVIVNETTMDGCREALSRAKSSYGIERGMKEKKRISSRRFPWLPKMLVGNVADSGSPERGDREHQATSNGTSEPGRHSKSTTPQQDHDQQKDLALIIDGNSLHHCLSEELEQELFDVAVACKVVVCCRMAPLQKAGVVSLVKRKTNEITLAIGDGANDVSMIQIAHVGIGISGQEGRQAAMSSDFAMGQFRFLQRVLLVQGHWNYNRLGYMVLYNLYRNVIFVLMLFWFILYTAFSPQSALTDWNLVFYSLLYTSIPTIVAGIFDKDLSDSTLLQNPPLYRSDQKLVGYSQPLFWAIMLDTLWQSLVLFYVPFLTYRHTSVGIYGLGTLWTIAVVILVNLHLAMDIRRWTWIHHVAIWASIAVAWIVIFIMDSIKSVKGLLLHYWVVHHMVTEWTFWFDILLIVALGLLPRFCVKIFRQRLFPSDIQIAREAEHRISLQVGGETTLSDRYTSVDPGVQLGEFSHSERSNRTSSPDLRFRDV